MRRRATVALSGALALVGLVLIVETALVGGGVGFVLGGLFLLAGGLRVYLFTR